MRTISDFSVKHPVAIVMAISAVLLLGYISFGRLGIDLFPDLNSPMLFVEMKAGETPPEEMEKNYVEQIESVANRLRGVTGVSSAIRVGSARVTVTYKWDTDMDEAFLDLQKSVTDFAQNSDIGEITITQHDPNSEPVMKIAFMHPEIEDLDELRKVAENYLRSELSRVEGIAGVEISGVEEKEVVVETDGYLLEAYGLTAEDVSGKIESYNQTVSGGSIVEMGLEYTIKGIGVYESLDDFGNIILSWRAAGDQEGSGAVSGAAVSTEDGEKVPVYLKDVARIRFVNKDPESIVMYNGRRCLGLSVYKEMKFNTVEASRTLRESLGVIGKALPGYELVVIQDQGRFITTSIDEVKQSALIGILLAVLILYVFLRRIGTTVIVSVSIPISIVATFNLMYFNGLSLNIMTLGGLALGAGMLVDNAIVVIENIIRNVEDGMDLSEAAISGTSQVSGAITASTITTIVVFLPIVYIHGASGELFKDQAWTVAFSLLSSLAVAVFVMPMMASRFLRKQPAAAVSRSIRFPWYGRILERVLRHRWKVIGATALLVAGSALLIPLVGSEFLPKTAMNEFTIRIRLPEGTELERTADTVAGIEDIARDILGDALETTYSVVGPTTGMSAGEESIFQDENTASIKIVLKKDNPFGSERIVSLLGSAISAIPDIEAEFIQDETALLASLGGDSAPIVVEIRGEELETLEQLASRVKEKLLEIGDLYNVETSLENGRPEVDIVIDRLSAGMRDLGVTSVGRQVSDLLAGRQAGQWDYEGEKKDITIKTPKTALGDLGNLVLDSGSGKLRLGEIAVIKHGCAPREINRNNRIRTAIVTAGKTKGRPFDHVIKDVRASLESIDLPPDYRFVITGEEEKRKAEFDDLRFALILSIVLVYMVMAAQFESLVHPFAILLSIPLAGVGAVLIFFILGRTLNIMAYIGIIMLVGIAVNDSIILIDAINNLRRAGVAKKEAIIEAGKRRIRPIIMTSATTILALLPLSIGLGEGAALRSPMALAVIGGLVTSTILTLFVIPCIYHVLDRAGE